MVTPTSGSSSPTPPSFSGSNYTEDAAVFKSYLDQIRQSPAISQEDAEAVLNTLKNLIDDYKNTNSSDLQTFLSANKSDLETVVYSAVEATYNQHSSQGIDTAFDEAENLIDAFKNIFDLFSLSADERQSPLYVAVQDIFDYSSDQITNITTQTSTGFHNINDILNGYNQSNGTDLKLSDFSAAQIEKMSQLFNANNSLLIEMLANYSQAKAVLANLNQELATDLELKNFTYDEVQFLLDFQSTNAVIYNGYYLFYDGYKSMLRILGEFNKSYPEANLILDSNIKSYLWRSYPVPSSAKQLLKYFYVQDLANEISQKYGSSFDLTQDSFNSIVDGMSEDQIKQILNVGILLQIYNTQTGYSLTAYDLTNAQKQELIQSENSTDYLNNINAEKLLSYYNTAHPNAHINISQILDIISQIAKEKNTTIAEGVKSLLIEKLRTQSLNDKDFSRDLTEIKAFIDQFKNWDLEKASLLLKNLQTFVEKYNQSNPEEVKNFISKYEDFFVTLYKNLAADAYAKAQLALKNAQANKNKAQADYAAFMVKYNAFTKDYSAFQTASTTLDTKKNELTTAQQAFIAQAQSTQPNATITTLEEAYSQLATVEGTKNTYWNIWNNTNNISAQIQQLEDTIAALQSTPESAIANTATIAEMNTEIQNLQNEINTNEINTAASNRDSTAATFNNLKAKSDAVTTAQTALDTAQANYDLLKQTGGAFTDQAAADAAKTSAETAKNTSSAAYDTAKASLTAAENGLPTLLTQYQNMFSSADPNLCASLVEKMQTYTASGIKGEYSLFSSIQELNTSIATAIKNALNPAASSFKNELLSLIEELSKKENSLTFDPSSILTFFNHIKQLIAKNAGEHSADLKTIFNALNNIGEGIGLTDDCSKGYLAALTQALVGYNYAVNGEDAAKNTIAMLQAAFSGSEIESIMPEFSSFIKNFTLSSLDTEYQSAVNYKISKEVNVTAIALGKTAEAASRLAKAITNASYTTVCNLITGTAQPMGSSKNLTDLLGVILQKSSDLQNEISSLGDLMKLLTDGNNILSDITTNVSTFLDQVKEMKAAGKSFSSLTVTEKQKLLDTIKSFIEPLYGATSGTYSTSNSLRSMAENLESIFPGLKDKYDDVVKQVTSILGSASTADTLTYIDTLIQTPYYTESKNSALLQKFFDNVPTTTDYGTKFNTFQTSINSVSTYFNTQNTQVQLDVQILTNTYNELLSSLKLSWQTLFDLIKTILERTR